MKNIIKTKKMETKNKSSIDRIYIEGKELLQTQFNIGCKYAYEIDFETKKVVIKSSDDLNSNRLVKMSKKIRRKISKDGSIDEKVRPLMDIRHPDIKRVFNGVTKCVVRVYDDKIIVTPKKEINQSSSSKGTLSKVLNLFSKKKIHEEVSYYISREHLNVFLKKASGLDTNCEQLSMFDLGYSVSIDSNSQSNYNNIRTSIDETKNINSAVNAVKTIKTILKDYKYFELFAGSGIGGMAFDEYGCSNVGYSEIDKHAIQNYEANFPNRVNFGDIKNIEINNLPDFDFLIGGSPCQDISIMRKVWTEDKQTEGLKGSESMLFFEYIRILNSKLPKWFIFENVQNLLKSNNGEDFKTVRELFGNHYNIKWEVMNTADYGIPQTRRRLFIVGQRKDLGDFDFIFPKKQPLTVSAQSFLEKNVADKYFLSEKMRDYVMSEGTGNFKQKPEINLKVARPLTASMHKNHRAGTDNYYSEDRVIPGKTNIRRLTPREAARLQGLDDSYKIVVSDTQAYKLMGNAMSLNVVRFIVRKLALYIKRVFGLNTFCVSC